MNLYSLWLTNQAQKGDLGPGSKAVDLARRVWQLEPLNVRHILAYAASLVAADLGLWRTLGTVGQYLLCFSTSML